MNTSETTQAGRHTKDHRVENSPTLHAHPGPLGAKGEKVGLPNRRGIFLPRLLDSLSWSAQANRVEAEPGGMFGASCVVSRVLHACGVLALVVGQAPAIGAMHPDRDGPRQLQSTGIRTFSIGATACSPRATCRLRDAKRDKPGDRTQPRLRSVSRAFFVWQSTNSNSLKSRVDWC